MAIENVQKFLQALDTNDDLAVRADDAYVAALHGVAAEAGFEFSEDELRTALDGAAGDLSEGELDHVVGGAYLSGATAATVDVWPTLDGSNANTVFGGTSGAVTQPSPLRFGSFSKSGFSR